MIENTTIKTRPMTVEEAFEWLCYYFQEEYSDDTVGEWLPSMTIKEWAELSEEVRECDFEWFFNDSGIVYEKEELKAAGFFTESLIASLTIQDFCKFIAEHSSVPVMEPVTILGKSCKPAGVFLVIRDILDRRGANASEISPSTPLQPFLKKWYRVFETDIAKLTVGKSPYLKWLECKLDYKIIMWFFVIGASIVLQVKGGFPSYISIPVGLFIVWVICGIAKTRCYIDPKIKTFGDLSRAIAKTIA